MRSSETAYESARNAKSKARSEIIEIRDTATGERVLILEDQTS
jgi:hypothetical protein